MDTEITIYKKNIVIENTISNMKYIINVLFLLTISMVDIEAQSEHFPLVAEESALSNVMQVIGIDTVKIEFSRPNLKGRMLIRRDDTLEFYMENRRQCFYKNRSIGKHVYKWT